MANKPAIGAFPSDKNKPVDQKQDEPAQATDAKSKQVQQQEHDAKVSKESQEKEAAAREEAAAKPKEYLFDPNKPAAYENQRDATARTAWQARLRVSQAAMSAALEARKLATIAINHGQVDAPALDAAAKKAEAAAIEAAHNVAPKPEPFEPEPRHNLLGEDQEEPAKSAPGGK